MNTAEMYYSAEFETVDVTISDGHIVELEKLKPGDILLFRGNLKRPAHIGHVEAVFDVPYAADDDVVNIEVDGMKKYKLRTIEIKDGKGMQGGDVLLVQEILRARGYTGRNGKPLVLDGKTGDDYETSNTMFAVSNYIKDRNKNGVDLGEPDGWGVKCWGDQNLPSA